VHLRAAGADAAPRGTLTIRGWTISDQLSRPDVDRIVDVPALSAEDERELKAGLLSHSSAAGRELGWAARDLAELKVGIAFGAGSLRGYAHIGVLDVLMRAGVPRDYVAGTSVGSAVATLLACGYDLERIGEILDDFSPNLFRLALPYRSLLSSRGINSYIRGFFGDTRLEDLTPPTAVVAADLLQQKEIVLRRGLVWQAVCASISIPGIYPAHRMGPYLMVDGGVLNPVPGSVVEQMGAGTVLAVNLLSGAMPAEHEAEAVPTVGRPPSAIVVMLRSIELMQSRMASEPHERTTIMIAPKLEPAAGAKLRRFSEGRRFIEDGRAAAEAALPRIAAALPWLRA
jgi:NTE family protein